MHTRGQIRWKLDVGSWRNVISFTAQKNPHFASAWPMAPKISCFLVHRFWFWANLARILTARSHNHFRSIQCKFGDDCFNWFFPTILLADKHTRPKNNTTSASRRSEVIKLMIEDSVECRRSFKRLRISAKCGSVCSPPTARSTAKRTGGLEEVLGGRRILSGWVTPLAGSRADDVMSDDAAPRSRRRHHSAFHQSLPAALSFFSCAYFVRSATMEIFLSHSSSLEVTRKHTVE